MCVERQREIDYQNKVLLKQLLSIEKDPKRTQNYNPHRSTTMSSFHSTSVAKREAAGGHAARNQKKTLEVIDYENARLYQKLRNRSCQVQKVGEMVNQYKEAQFHKKRISKQRRGPLGVPNASSISPLRSNRRNLAGVPVLHPNPYKDL